MEKVKLNNGVKCQSSTLAFFRKLMPKNVKDVFMMRFQ